MILKGRQVHNFKSISLRACRDADIMSLDIRGRKQALGSGWIGDGRESDALSPNIAFLVFQHKPFSREGDEQPDACCLAKFALMGHAPRRELRETGEDK
jgi:hypothetical protein